MTKVPSAVVLTTLPREDLAVLVESGRELAAQVSLDVLLKNILKRASELTDSPDTSVILVNERGDGLYFAGATGAKSKMLLDTWGEFSAQQVPIEGSVAGTVFKTGRSVVVGAAKQDPRHFKGVDHATRKVTESMVCVPLRIDGAPIGVMQLLNKRTGPYSDRDKLLLEYFADQAAVAIRNARLFEKLLAHMGLWVSRQQQCGPLELLRELNQPARSERLSVLFADMRSFAQLCLILNDPEKTRVFLNEFVSMLAREVIAHGGIVNKFLGDGLLALFRRGTHAERAVRSAFAMVDGFEALHKSWRGQTNARLDILDIGIGIVTDKVIVGTFGSDQTVRDFTAVGTGVNMAAFLEQQARGGKRILVSRLTRKDAQGVIGACEGPEYFDLKKSGQTADGPDGAYEYWVLRSLAGKDVAAPGPSQLRVRTFPEPSTEAPDSPGAPVMPGDTATIDRVFISYSRKDRDWLDHIQTMISPMVRGKAVSVWWDGKIKASSKWREEIDRALGAARVALLLVSPNFLASDFINNEELPYLLKAAERRGVKLMWVLLRNCLYKRTDLARYQAAHDVARPLSHLSEPERDDALVAICEQIAELART